MNMIVGLCHRQSSLQQLTPETPQALKSFHSLFRSELFGHICFEGRATTVMILLRGLIFLILLISIFFPFGSPLGCP